MLNKDIESAVNNMNSNQVDDKSAKRDGLIKEIDNLQREAQEVISKENSETRIAEINAKLEKLLEEIKSLNLWQKKEELWSSFFSPKLNLTICQADNQKRNRKTNAGNAENGIKNGGGFMQSFFAIGTIEQ